MTKAVDVFNLHLGVLGATGSGKTYTAKGIVEALLDQGKRVCIVDPTGVWWGLKSSADGKKPGYPVTVFGGERADVEISEDSGEPLAKIIAKENIPAVIDTSLMKNAPIKRFMTKFLEGLMLYNRRPLHLIMDEADLFAPQQPLGDAKHLLHEMNTVVSRGRVKGLRVMLISQRPAKLHKNVLTQVSALVLMKFVGPQDIKAVRDWIELQAGGPEHLHSILESLATLKTGEGWLWAPEFGVLERQKFPKISSFDSSSTPDDDSEYIEPHLVSLPDLEKLHKKLGQVSVKKAAPQKRLAAKQPPAVDEKAIFEEGRQAGFAEAEAIYAKRLEDVKDRLASMSGSIQSIIGSIETPPKTNVVRPKQFAPKVKDEGPVSRDLGPERKPLRALASVYPTKLTESQWATLTGLKRTGGTWANYKSALKTKGFVETDGNTFCATESGLKALGEKPAAPQGAEEVRGMWRSKIGAAKKVLDVLIAAYPEEVHRDDLAVNAGLTAGAGTFSNYLSTCRTNELIEETDRGWFRVAKFLMEDAA